MLVPRLMLLALLLIPATLSQAQPIFAKRMVVKAKEPTVDQLALDTKALESANLSADKPESLIAYLKQRTLSDSDLQKIQNVIKSMGDEQFEERVKASLTAEKFGPAAIGPLRTAAQGDPDPEVAFRAGETLKRIEKVSHAAIASAVARALAKTKSPDAVAAMLGFFPMADTTGVEDDLHAAIAILAIRDGVIDPAILTALEDKLPARRATSAIALLEACVGNPKLSADAAKKVKVALAKETDGETKFSVGFTLATVTRDVDAVAELITSIPDLSRGRIWQAEDFLIQLAGKNAPKTKMGPLKPDLEKARDSWRKWWDGAKGTTDFSKLDFKPTTTGRIALMTMDQSGWGNGWLAEFGPDMRRRWRMAGINAPADFQFLPNGRVLILEQNYSRITERTLNGAIVFTFNPPPGQPVGMQRLPNGHTLVACRQMAVEYNEKWEEKNKYARPNNNDILAVGRYENGPTIVLTTNPGKLIRLDEKWKELPNPVNLTNNPFYQPRMELLPNDRVLVTEQNRVAEYDMKSDKKEPVWFVNVNSPTSVQRFSNGNTLIVDTGSNAVKEYTPEKEVVWTHSVTDGMRLVRAERR